MPRNKIMHAQMYRWSKLEQCGWTADAFTEALFEQDNKCATCGKTFHGEDETRADHDHSTGKHRGVLCNRCNLQLGTFEKNRDLYEVKFPEYLKRWRNGSS